MFYRTKSQQHMSPPIFTTFSSRSSRTRCVPLVSLPRRRALLNCQCECSLFKNLMEMLYMWMYPLPLITGQFCRIKCKIFKTKEDITIKISDQVGQSRYWSSLLPLYLWYFDNRTPKKWLSQGGGISRNEKRKVFNYMYSTAPQVKIVKTVKNVIPTLGYWWILFRQLGWVSLPDDVDILQLIYRYNEFACNECRWNGWQVVDWDFMQACEMAVCQCMVWAMACLSPGSTPGIYSLSLGPGLNYLLCGFKEGP